MNTRIEDRLYAALDVIHKILPVAVVAGLATLFLVLVLVYGINAADWVSRSVQIEQLRAESRQIDYRRAPDIARLVAETNLKIVSAQRWRKSRLGFLLPREWDAVKLIEMPAPEPGAGGARTR